MSDPICVVCGQRPTPDGYACTWCANRTEGKLADVIDLTPDARLVAAGLVRRGGGSGSNKPGSRSPLNDGATDAVHEIEDQLVRLALDIARTRGVTFTVSCIKSCVKPSPTNAHCGACHVTFGSVSGFDRHRRNGQCLDPETLPMHLDDNGIWRMDVRNPDPNSPGSRWGLPLADENASPVPAYTPRDSEPAETISGGSA